MNSNHIEEVYPKLGMNVWQLGCASVLLANKQFDHIPQELEIESYYESIGGCEHCPYMENCMIAQLEGEDD